MSEDVASDAAPRPAAPGGVSVASTRERRRPGGTGALPGSVPVAFSVRDVGVSYGAKPAIHDLTLDIGARQITALIGPSGCGKTTFLRCLNRMNDLVPDARVTGSVHFRGKDIYDGRIRPIDLRRRIGMVFQRPNPFPKSIWENVAFAPRSNGARRSELEGIVESALRSAALWDEVKDKLRTSAFSLSGGQQQRLCIARAVAVSPQAILMDEPCSALDPIATARVEDLLNDLKQRYTIVIVTHNMQQAARISDRTAFLSPDERGGTLVELGDTDVIFTSPSDRRTEDYVSGRFG